MARPVARPRPVARRRPDLLYDRPREFWLSTLIRMVAILTASYFVAIFINLVLQRISEIPHGPLWDAALKGPLFFIMLMLTTAGVSIPYWMKEWDPNLRSFSMFTTCFVIAYAVFDGTGVLDPEMPLKWLMAHVVQPLKTKLVP